MWITRHRRPQPQKRTRRWRIPNYYLIIVVRNTINNIMIMFYQKAFYKNEVSEPCIYILYTRLKQNVTLRSYLHAQNLHITMCHNTTPFLKLFFCIKNVRYSLYVLVQI